MFFYSLPIVFFRKAIVDVDEILRIFICFGYFDVAADVTCQTHLFHPVFYFGRSNEKISPIAA